MALAFDFLNAIFDYAPSMITFGVVLFFAAALIRFILPFVG